MKKCGAKNRQGSTCGKPAGWGTDHRGEGRCKLHGGSNPIKHGRYSTITREPIRKLIEQYEQDPNPMDILPELAAMRALFTDYIERYDEWRDALLAWHSSWNLESASEKPRQVLDVADAYRLLAEVTKIVERIEKIRAENAVSRKDFIRCMEEMGRGVDRFVTNEAVREKIRDYWLTIRVA